MRWTTPVALLIRCYKFALIVLPGTMKARSHLDHLPGDGRPGFRSLRQQTLAPGGTSMNLVALLGIVNSRVEM